MNKPKRDGKTTKTPVKKVAGKLAKKTGGKVVKKTARKAAKKIVKKAVKKMAKKAVKKAVKKTVTSAAQKSSAPKVSAKKASVKKSAVKKTAAAPLTTKIGAVKSRRPKTFAARDLARGFGFSADTPDLPELYGEDRLVLMTKDPEYLFAYWEITPERQAAGEKAMRAGEEYREALRLNWTARDLFDANYTLMPVSLAARKWYLRVPYSGIPYQIEIGWLGSQGHFISLLMSNPSDAPESWNATRRRLKDSAGKGSVLARTLAAGQPQGSSGLPRVDTVPVPGDWNFAGPGSLASSFGKKAGKVRTKPGSRG
jgi:hypothetical protein